MICNLYCELRSKNAFSFNCLISTYLYSPIFNSYNLTSMAPIVTFYINNTPITSFLICSFLNSVQFNFQPTQLLKLTKWVW